MKDIESEFQEVRSRMRGMSAAEFFADRNNEPDWEWRILYNAIQLLKSAGESFPKFAEKGESPDFVTFREDKTHFAGIEVTEVLRPGYPRNRFHQEEERSGRGFRNIPAPHSTPWKSLAETLEKKFRKSYGHDCWLLVYLDMSRLEFHKIDSLELDQPWEQTVIRQLATWPKSEGFSVDLSESPFERVVLMSADFSGLMEVFPKIKVIQNARPFDCDE